jgi:hypothetical protein
MIYGKSLFLLFFLGSSFSLSAIFPALIGIGREKRKRKMTKRGSMWEERKEEGERKKQDLELAL